MRVDNPYCTHVSTSSSRKVVISWIGLAHACSKSEREAQRQLNQVSITYIRWPKGDTFVPARNPRVRKTSDQERTPCIARLAHFARSRIVAGGLVVRPLAKTWQCADREGEACSLPGRKIVPGGGARDSPVFPPANRCGSKAHRTNSIMSALGLLRIPILEENDLLQV